MRKVTAWVVLSLCLGVLAACSDPDRPPPGDMGPVSDAGDGGIRRDGGDGGACAGRTLCTTAGTSCDADTLVTCAEDADGCLVETRVGCATGDVCDATSGTAACVDVCSLLPPASVCTTDGERTCTGATLGVCAANADGCLVITETDCAATPGGVCDTTGAMPMCVLPADPCAAIPAADRCTTAGTTCSGTSLVDCAPNAFGCLVTTTTDCTTRSGGACDATGAAAICTSTDACGGVTTCATAGTSCAGPSLVECAPDAFGCLVETTTDCTTAAFGFCDAAATPSAMCSTAAVDPCLGMTACGTATTRTCTDRATLTVCAPNAFGCYVSTDTTCTTTGEVCDALGATAVCVDACSLVTTCTAATVCDGNDLATCTANADGCLVESSRETCPFTCSAASGAAACSDPYCPEAQPTVLDCASGTVNGNTLGGTSTRPGYCSGGTSYGGPERIYRFTNAGTARMAVRIVATRLTGTEDMDLFVWDAGDGTNVCTAGTITCLDSSTGVGATETVDFFGEPGQTEYVAYDIYSSDTATTDFTLTVTCTPIVCGDGILATGETCDDGNTVAADGCSATCTTEAGFGCTGTPSVCTPLCGNGVVGSGETCDDGGIVAGDGCSATCAIEAGYGCSGAPSVCVALAVNSVCSGATAVTATSTLTGENIALGGPRPTGTGCGTSSGTKGLYYAVTIPALTSVDLDVTPTFDAVLVARDACGSATCNLLEDDPETGTITNSTGAPVTRIVAVYAWSSSTSSGTFDISFTYVPYVCGNGRPEGAEACDDGNTATADGCSATCTVEPGYLCSGTPSVCVTSATNGTCATATSITATTNVTGEATIGGGPRPTGTSCGTGTGNNTLYYAVTVPPMTHVDVLTAPAVGSDIVLLTEDACGAAACSLRTATAPERTTLTNSTGAAFTRIVAIHNNLSATQAVFDVSFTYVPFACGNGRVEAAEACDDSGVVNGDGCSATCTVEANYLCSGSPSVCRAIAANASCATGTAVAATTTILAENIALGGLPLTGTPATCGSPTTNRALYYTVTIPAYTRVDVLGTPSFDAVLNSVDSCGAAACGLWEDDPESGSLANNTASPITRVVSMRTFSTSVTTGTFDIAFTYVPFVCGDGLVEGAETCDDSNVVSGDGCSSTCVQEATYACVGSPSVCVTATANAFCASAEPVTATTSFTGESTAGGGARPTGTNCGTDAGNRTLWYAVTVPAGQSVLVQTTPGTSNIALFTQSSCADTTCSFFTNTSPERTTIANPGSAPITRVVGIRGATATAATYDVAFTYSTLAYSSFAAACIDISSAAANTYTTTSTDDATTAATALPIPFTFFGAPVTYWSMNTNGLMQLFPDATGTPSNAWTNVVIPTAGTPNNLIAPFWDDMSIGSLLGGGTGSTRTATTGSGTSRVQVFEWNVSHFGADNLRFQVQLHETTNVVEIHYCSTGTGTGTDTGSSATIGFEDATGAAGIQISRDTGGAAVTGIAYRYTP